MENETVTGLKSISAWNSTKKLPSGTTALQINFIQRVTYGLSFDRLIPPTPIPLASAALPSIYKKTTSGYDIEHMHLMSLVDHAICSCDFSRHFMIWVSAAVFDHPMAGKDIGSLLCEIKQGNRSAAEYALEFRTLATGSGWSNPALRTVYKRGLRKDLRAEMACRGEALTLDRFIQTSIALDNELDEKRQLQPPYSGAVHATFGEPEPMELGRMGLSVEERHRSSSTQLTPFQCVLGFQPPLFPWTGEPSTVPSVVDGLDEERAHKLGRKRMCALQRRSKPQVCWTIARFLKHNHSSNLIGWKLPPSYRISPYVSCFAVKTGVCLFSGRNSNCDTPPGFRRGRLPLHIGSARCWTPGAEGGAFLFGGLGGIWSEERSWVPAEDILDPSLITDFSQRSSWMSCFLDPGVGLGGGRFVRLEPPVKGGVYVTSQACCFLLPAHRGHPHRNFSPEFHHRTCVQSEAILYLGMELWRWSDSGPCGAVEGWYRKNNLNVKKTKEMIVDFRRGRHAHLPLHVGGSAVEVVSNYRRLRRAGLGSSVLTSFYRCMVESVLCSSINVWHGSCSAADRKALQRVVEAAQRYLTFNCSPGTMDRAGHCFGQVCLLPSMTVKSLDACPPSIFRDGRWSRGARGKHQSFKSDAGSNRKPVKGAQQWSHVGELRKIEVESSCCILDQLQGPNGP
ncbi:hypothetical protein NFI96_034385 [Prochilodus magdalenae]|nr:hypothetical protein NFI96_034385 [Prochilodus magdalenae]